MKLLNKLRKWFAQPTREYREHYAQCTHGSWAFVNAQPIGENLIQQINADMENPLNQIVSSYLIDKMLGITPNGVEITPEGYIYGEMMLNLEIQKYLN